MQETAHSTLASLATFAKECGSIERDLSTGLRKKHSVHNLVYYELFADMPNAITREKRLKKWRRSWKLRLIEHKNPYWEDLWQQILA
jgi:putative endonuclease